MGSFDYNDDYSSFDNLLDRTTLLTEGRRSGLSTVHPAFGTLTGKLRDVGSTAFTRDSRKFVVDVLYTTIKPNIITEEELDQLRAAGPEASPRYKVTLQEILDGHKDEITERSDEIGTVVEDRFPAFANEILGRGPERIQGNIDARKAKLAAKEIANDIKQGEDIDDSIDDALDSVLVQAAINKVLTNIQTSLGEPGLDIEEEAVQQVVDYAERIQTVDQLADFVRQIAKEPGYEKIALYLSAVVKPLRGNKPEEDFEEDEADPYRGMYEPGDSENAYAEGESEAQSTEVEDEEDFPVHPNNDQGFTAKDIQISFMDNSEYEYDRVGVGKVGDGVFVADIENFGDPGSIWRVNFDSVEDVIKDGLAAGWLVKTENGYDEKDRYRFSMGEDDLNKFENWLRVNLFGEEGEEVISRESLNNNMRKKKLLFEKKKNWIQGAVDPAHKGYCTPMSKKTCTPHRKALARRFKKGISDEEDSEGWGRIGKGALLGSLLGKGAITGGLAGAAYHALKGETPKKEEKKEEKKKRGSWSGANYEDEEGKPQPGDYGSIEDLFTQKVWYIGDRGDTFEVADFEEFKPYILNWDTLLEIMDEENTEGFSERWEEVKFGVRSENEEDRDREKPGGSNAGDYPNVDKSDFCGPAGGAPEGSYPVNSEKRARAALSYAHNAPDPEGIKRCVYKKAKEHGWFDESEDEEYRHSPMLDSHQTNTSGYLTEQVAKDKRNKKPEVKNQSFKERFKPKTHWQLEELRRMGL